MDLDTTRFQNQLRKAIDSNNLLPALRTGAGSFAHPDMAILGGRTLHHLADVLLLAQIMPNGSLRASCESLNAGLDELVAPSKSNAYRHFKFMTESQIVERGTELNLLIVEAYAKYTGQWQILVMQDEFDLVATPDEHAENPTENARRVTTTKKGRDLMEAIQAGNLPSGSLLRQILRGHEVMRLMAVFPDGKQFVLCDYFTAFPRTDSKAIMEDLMPVKQWLVDHGFNLDGDLGDRRFGNSTTPEILEETSDKAVMRLSANGLQKARVSSYNANRRRRRRAEQGRLSRNGLAAKLFASGELRRTGRNKFVASSRIRLRDDDPRLRTVVVTFWPKPGVDIHRGDPLVLWSNMEPAFFFTSLPPGPEAEDHVVRKYPMRYLIEASIQGTHAWLNPGRGPLMWTRALCLQINNLQRNASTFMDGVRAARGDPPIEFAKYAHLKFCLLAAVVALLPWLLQATGEDLAGLLAAANEPPP